MLSQIRTEKKEIKISVKNRNKWLVLLAILGILIILGVIIWQLFFTNRGVNFNVTAPETVMSGELSKVYFSIENNSFNNLHNVKIVVSLPEGSYKDNLEKENKISLFLGEIKKGQKIQKELKVRLIGPPNSFKEISASLLWKVSGFQLGLKKEIKFKLGISQPIIKLNLNLPKKIIPGVPFEAEIVYRNNSLSEIEGALIKIEVPEEFEIEATNPTIDNIDNIIVGKLLASQQGRLKIKGRIKSNLVSKKSSFYFRALIGFESRNLFIKIDEQKASVAVSESLLPISIKLNGSKNYIARLGESLTYTINYTNRTEVALSNVIISAQIDGDLFDLYSIVTNGYFDPTKKSIIWNGGNTPALKLVGSQESGQVSFRIRLKNKFPQQGFRKNFTLKVIAEIESLSVPYYVAAKKLTNIDEITAKVRGSTYFECSAFFRDAASGFVNDGPWPPKVGQPTEYTVHFRLRNYATDIENIRIRAILDNGVTFEGLGHFKKIGNFPDPKYNKRTNEFSLNIPTMLAWDGIKNTPLELIFQIKLIPSFNQAGEGAGLIKNIILEAKDDFSGLTIIRKCDSIATSDLYKFDKTVKASEGSVLK